MVICEYCNHSFSSRGSLYNHQHKTIYCLEIQKTFKPDILLKKFECKWCIKSYTRNENLLEHQIICKKNPNIDIDLIKLKYEEEIKKYKEENDNLKQKLYDSEKRCIELQARLEERTNSKEEFKELHSKREECIEKIAMQPKSNTSNTQNTLNSQIINNLPIFNLTAKQLEEEAEEGFSLDLFLQGQVGVAKFTINIARKNHDDKLPWIVSDHVRGIFKTKDKDGNIIIDRKAQKLTEMVMEAVKKKNQEHHDSFYPKRDYKSDDERDEAEIDRVGKIELDDQMRADDCYMDIMKMKRDNSVFMKNLIKESNK